MAAVISAAGLAGIGMGSVAGAQEDEPALQLEYGSPDEYGYQPDDDNGYYPTYYPTPSSGHPTTPPPESPTPSMPPSSPPALPETGSGSLTVVGLGLGLIVLGLVAWLLAGRRRARI